MTNILFLEHWTVTVWKSLLFEHNVKHFVEKAELTILFAQFSSKLQLSWHKLKPFYGNSSNIQLHSDYHALKFFFSPSFSVPAVLFKWLFSSYLHSRNCAAASNATTFLFIQFFFSRIHWMCIATNWAYFLPFHFRFDVLVNGGGAVTLQFQRSPFHPMTRTVFVPWNQVNCIPI